MNRFANLLLFCFWAMGSHAPACAQAPVQTHYFLNPYVYNPAFVGSAGYTEVFLTHRRQWVEIEGAPVTSMLSLHLPTRSAMAFGANLYTARQGLINTTGGMATAGYLVRLSHNQYLRGGISLGLRSVGIDQAQANATDPSDLAFISDYNNHIGIDGTAGLAYQIAGLTLGAAMSNPFRRPSPLDSRMDKTATNPLSHLMLSGGYRIELDDIVIEPQVLYGSPSGSKPWIEALATLFLRDKVWVGGSYRNGYGSSFFGGARIAEVIRIGYGYELASQQVNGIGRGSHELMVSYRFGEKKGTGSANGQRDTKGDNFKKRYFQQQQRKVDKAAEQKRQEARKAQKQKEDQEKQLTSDKKDTGSAHSVSAKTPADEQGPTMARTDSVQAPGKAMFPVGGQTKTQAKAPGTAQAGDRRKDQVAPATTRHAAKNTAIRPAPRRSRPGVANEKREIADKAVNQPSDAEQPAQLPQAEDKAPTDQNFQSLQRTVHATESKHPDEIQKGYYVVVGTFQYKENAQRFVKTMNEKGFAGSGFKFSSETSYYYVYVLQTQDIEVAKRDWMKLRQVPGFEDSWVNVLHVQ